MADALFGDVNPGGKLPATYPRNAGFSPFYYARNLTFQPEGSPRYQSRSWDGPTTAVYPFGYGLSYTTFAFAAHASTVDLDQIPTADVNASSLCALDDALESLTRIDPRRAKVVELRFFGGLSVEETAEALQISPQTVMRDWRLANAWLARELRGGSSQSKGQILFLARLSSFADSRGAGDSTIERANASH